MIFREVTFPSGAGCPALLIFYPANGIHGQTARGQAQPTRDFFATIYPHAQ